MLHKVSLLETLTIQATDAELGKVKDVYFDADEWAVRYFLVDTRKWLPGKKVLVPPSSVDTVNIEENTITLNATKEQVENSPSPAEHEPISRRIETELHHYYGLHPYWRGSGIMGGGMYPGQTRPAAGDYGEANKVEEKVLDEVTSQLRGMNELQGLFGGYKVFAKDKELGTLTDFVIDDNSWAITYVLIDTGDILPGEKVLLSTESITQLDVAEKRIYADIDSNKVENTEETLADEQLRILEWADMQEVQKRRLG